VYFVIAATAEMWRMLAAPLLFFAELIARSRLKGESEGDRLVATLFNNVGGQRCGRMPEQSRWLSADAAAAHLDLRVDAFLRKVHQGVLPKPTYALGPRTPR
jgi:hypothetical protein